MKKTILTLSLIALFNTITKAQDPVKKTPESKPANTSTQEEPKKSGTRMAINEKGLPGTKPTTAKKETPKEEKSGAATSPTGPVSKPQ